MIGPKLMVLKTTHNIRSEKNKKSIKDKHFKKRSLEILVKIVLLFSVYLITSYKP